MINIPVRIRCTVVSSITERDARLPSLFLKQSQRAVEHGCSTAYLLARQLLLSQQYVLCDNDL